ncbi:MAG TPA: heavy metal-binding domain-containing protein, partial [Polyangiaceae bacterium]|nr:heavy metal-binding domain-containing protein [Polyangiaceae bacterium]
MHPKVGLDASASHRHGQSDRQTARIEHVSGKAKIDPSASTPPVAPGAVYTCPMHPDIRENDPGACPKCGMAL